MGNPANGKWWDKCIGISGPKKYTANLYVKPDSKSKKLAVLLWGDRVRVLDSDGDWRKVSVRNFEGWVLANELSDEALLEIYIIDVGQGDGILFVTPEGHNIMIDGGDTRSRQNGGRNAADFVDWKFYKDYTSRSNRPARGDAAATIALDAMIVSHCDQDHFGGLWDMTDMNDTNKAELDCGSVTAENLYHAGLSYWRKPAGSGKTLGAKQDGHFTQLLSGRDSAVQASRDNIPKNEQVGGNWGKFVRTWADLKKQDGSHTHIEALSQNTGFLQGFAPGDSAISVEVLGPVIKDIGGKDGLKDFKSTSYNTNGHSVILKLKYKDRSFLLTGDLNTSSQKSIMEHYGIDFKAKFEVDAAKGCHHGSHDVHYGFLQGVAPYATVISSGDAEGHDHPRPTLLAATGMTSRKLWKEVGVSLKAPLIYSTEIARSVKFRDVEGLRRYDTAQGIGGTEKGTTDIKLKTGDAAMRQYRLVLKQGSNKYYHRPRLDRVKGVEKLRYGLVNVRTDGKHMLFATMAEKGNGWQINTLEEEDFTAFTFV